MAAGDVGRLPLHTCELKTAEKGSRCTTFDITVERKSTSTLGGWIIINLVFPNSVIVLVTRHISKDAS